MHRQYGSNLADILFPPENNWLPVALNKGVPLPDGVRIIRHVLTYEGAETSLLRHSGAEHVIGTRRAILSALQHFRNL